MARTDCPIAEATRAGVGIGTPQGTEVTGDNANNHSFLNDGKTILVVRATATAANTLTLVLAAGGPDGATVTNPAATAGLLDTSGDMFILGPFPPAIYNQPSDPGRCYFNVNNANLKIQAIHVGS